MRNGLTFMKLIIYKQKNQFITLTDVSKMLIRNNPAVVRVLYFKISDYPDNFYYNMLLQYLPYHREDELIGEYNHARKEFMAR